MKSTMVINVRDVQDYIAKEIYTEIKERNLYCKTESANDIIRQEMDLLESDIRRIIMNDWLGDELE